VENSLNACVNTCVNNSLNNSLNNSVRKGVKREQGGEINMATPGGPGPKYRSDFILACINSGKMPLFTTDKTITKAG